MIPTFFDRVAAVARAERPGLRPDRPAPPRFGADRLPATDDFLPNTAAATAGPVTGTLPPVSKPPDERPDAAGPARSTVVHPPSAAASRGPPPTPGRPRPDRAPGAEPTTPPRPGQDAAVAPPGEPAPSRARGEAATRHAAAAAAPTSTAPPAPAAPAPHRPAPATVAPRAPPPERGAADHAPLRAPPDVTVTVSIGRIEVRATPPPSPPPGPAPRPAPRLDDYLRARREG